MSTEVVIDWMILFLKFNEKCRVFTDLMLLTLKSNKILFYVGIEPGFL